MIPVHVMSFDDPIRPARCVWCRQPVRPDAPVAVLVGAEAVALAHFRCHAERCEDPDSDE